MIVYMRGGGANNSNGVNFEHHRKLLSLRSFAVSFSRTAFNSDFKYIFLDFIHIYSLRARADNLG